MSDKKTTVARERGVWVYRSSDPFVDGQPVGRTKPAWARLVMIKAIARDLCLVAGDNPDAIGEPGSTNGAAVADQAFPRWMSYVRKAENIVDHE